MNALVASRLKRGLLVPAVLLAATLAQVAPASGATITSTGTISFGAGTTRTPCTEPVSPSGPTRAPQVDGTVPFRPTMSADQYRQVKDEAAREAVAGPLAPEAAPKSTPPSVINSFDGLKDTDNPISLRPPDPHGAKGGTQFVEIVNTSIRVLSTAGATLCTRALADFFDYDVELLFDPRVVFDPGAQRWMASAASRDGRYFFAISTSIDATAGWVFHDAPLTGVDYPQLGFSAGGVLVTASIFNPSLQGASFFCMPKTDVGGTGAFLVDVFGGLRSTLAPPIVLGTSTASFLAAAEAPLAGTEETSIALYKTTGCGGSTVLSSEPDIPVNGYKVPPNAQQRKSSEVLDTLDARFVNASTQIGDSSLWQVHTIRKDGRARPRFYEFNLVTRAVRQSGTFFVSGSSYDFNASIAAKANGAAFVTWSVTDPSNKKKPSETRLSGRRGPDPLGAMGSPGKSVFSTKTVYNASPSTITERWGDYSAVSIDFEAAGDRAWVVNETILSPTLWGTRIAQTGF